MTSAPIFPRLLLPVGVTSPITLKTPQCIIARLHQLSIIFDPVAGNRDEERGTVVLLRLVSVLRV
jgi:hypothetical protein